MANTNVLKLAGDLRSSSSALIERIADSRRKAHDVVLDLRDLEEAIKARIREDRERATAEEPEAPLIEAVAEPAAPVEAPVAAVEWKEGPAPEPPKAVKPKKKAEPEVAAAAAPEPPKESAVQEFRKLEIETPAPAKPAAKAEPVKAEPAKEEKPKAELPKPEPAKPEAPRERIFMPRPDDRPRPSYGRTDDRLPPRPPQQQQGTFTPRVGANGPFIPKPRPEGGYPPRVGANGAFIPKPRPEGQGPVTRPAGGGYRPGGGGYGQRPVTEKDIKKQLLVTPTQQKERVSNYDPNKTDLRRREKVAESQAEDKKNRNKKTLITDIVPGADMDDFYSPQGSHGRRPKKLKKQIRPERIVIDQATITGERVAIKTLAEKIGKPGAEIIKKLFLLGIIATINQDIDYDTAALVASEFGITLSQELEKSFEERMVDIYGTQDDKEKLQIRPPVVTIMGHVDHGKTSLLDAIRSTKVAAGEAGGITQHIGAYSVEIKNRPITFLDTPGHEAFTSMRARGAQATDIAVLVIAADDGVMPQTVEAINHAKAAKVPIIVALNKIDLPDADPDRIKQQLTEYELVAEEWGGETVIAPVSAVTKEGIDHLLEMILLVADVQELRANPDSPARGIVVEAKLDKWRGPVATVLIQNGTLRPGDYVVAGTTFGRVRAMNDDMGKRVDVATPAMPVEVMGLSDTPEAGDIFYAVEDEKLARQVAGERRLKARSESMGGSAMPMKLDDLYNRMAQEEVIDLNIIIRADVRGSAEAVKSALEKLSSEKVRIRTLQSGVGSINENDIMLAAASSAIVIGFNVRPDSKAADAAERENVDVRTYRIIYQAIEDMEKAMKGLLKPEFKEVILGHAEIRSLIKLSSVGLIAGSYVTDGKASRTASIRLLRDGVVVFEGKLGSLKRFKDDVREVEKGYECGMSIDGYGDIKEGDIVEFFTKEEIKIE